MTTVEFRMLGPVEMRVDGRAIGLGHAKQRCVLALLLCEVGLVVSAERLIDRIWGSQAPASASNILHGHITRLRKAIAPVTAASLVRRHGGYVLDVAPATIDLYRFRALIERARVARDDLVGLGALVEAQRLWRGPALAGVDGPWVRQFRMALENERLSARLDACDIRIRLGLDEGLVVELSHLAADNPLHEGVVSRLMMALYRSGDTGATIEQYGQIRRRLADELGMDPGSELTSLYRRVLRHDETLSPV
jgi:DNA-binding SARP family transcriptional activator